MEKTITIPLEEYNEMQNVVRDFQSLLEDDNHVIFGIQLKHEDYEPMFHEGAFAKFDYPEKIWFFLNENTDNILQKKLLQLDEENEKITEQYVIVRKENERLKRKWWNIF